MGCVIKYKNQSIPEEQFLQYLNKQIAINTLFNENESLANSVYLAMGFEKKNIEEYEDVVDKQTYQYLDRVQQLEDWKIEPQPIIVKNLDTYIKKITLGTQKDKYEVNVYENGIEVNKYFDTKEEAIHQALEYSNYYTRQNNNILFKNTKDRNDYLNKEIGKVVDKANENEDFRKYYAKILGSKITPQQKQEAQLAYSNYLDTGKQDIQGFKEFVSKSSTSVKEGITNITPKEILVRYTPKGKEEQVYAVRGSKIINKDGKEVFKENGVDRYKIFANVAVLQKRAVVVTYDNTKYVVNEKQQILSGKTGKLMQWNSNNGNRIAILKLASDKFAMNNPEGLPSIDRTSETC